MTGIQLLINELWTDIDFQENWKVRQDAQHRIIDARLLRHWALEYTTTIEGALTLGFLGGPIVSAAGVVTMGADGTIALTDNATNYVERTLAGVVSANTSGFTTGRLPMYKIVVASSAFTSIEDWRVFGSVLATALLAIAGVTPAADKFAYFTSGTAAALADISSFTRTLTGGADAAAWRTALSVPSISYVDTLVAGLDMKASARVATTGNVNLANGLENGDTIDGVTLATGDRVLVKSQTAPAENGIYIVPASGAAARASDADAWAELPGAFLAIEEGTANADTVWLCTANAGGTLNTTAVTFTQFGAGAPAAHATSHQSGGSDAIKLDDLAAPDDNTDLNATSSLHGLTKKLGAAETYLGSDGTNQTWRAPLESLIIPCSDETTDLTTGTAKMTFRMPYAFTLTDVRASLNAAPTGTALTVDINEAGTTILSTKLTIDVSEETSTTAATPAVISDASLADDAKITIDIDAVGTGAKGLKVTLIGRRT